MTMRWINNIFALTVVLLVGLISGYYMANVNNYDQSNDPNNYVSREVYNAQVFETCRYAEQQFFLARGIEIRKSEQLALDNCKSYLFDTYKSYDRMAEIFSPRHIIPDPAGK